MRSVLNIEARKIFVPEGRMRPVNAERVEELRDSIQKGELLQPLVVGVPNADKLWPLVDGAHRLAALKKLKCRLVPCHSINGNKYVRRLAEIEANLLNSPLTRLETHEHEVERERLLEVMYGKPARGGDRRSKDFQVGQNSQLENPSDGRAKRAGRSDRSKRRSIHLCKLLSAEERSRLKGTAVANCDKDLFAIAGIGDIQQRTAVIDALSDAEKPAPSLYEAKYRAGLVQPPERDLKKEAEQKVFQEVDLLFRVLFYGGYDVLDRFLGEVADQKPDFLGIMTEVVKRLKSEVVKRPTDEGGES